MSKYLFTDCSCFCRHNKRQKKQDVALLTSMQPLPAKRRVATQPLPVPISLASRQPVQPAMVMTIQFAPNTAGQAEFWKEGSSRKTQKSAMYRNMQLDKDQPNRKRNRRGTPYECKHRNKPKTKDYGHNQPKRGKWYCPEFSWNLLICALFLCASSMLYTYNISHALRVNYIHVLYFYIPCAFITTKN